MEAQGMVAQDGAFGKSRMLMEGLLSSMEEAAAGGERLDRVENEVHHRLQDIGRSLLQEHVEAQGTGDLGPTLEYKGRELRRLEDLHERRVMTVFGGLVICRAVYGTRETQKHELVPLDARLGLPEGEFSYLLQDWAQSFCIEESHEQSQTKLERILGFRLTVRSLEHMNQQMAQAVPSFLAARPAPPLQEEGSILVVTVDGKGVPMRREASEQPAQGRKRRRKGEKANKKREACVGAVYSIEPFVRTPQDIVNDTLRKRRREDRPEPRHKRLRAELTHPIEGQEVRGKELTFRWLVEEVAQRRQPGQPLIFLSDGDAALHRMQQNRLPGAVCILDIYHAIERIWDAATCFHPEGSQEANDFVVQRLERILEGKVGRVIGGLRQMATKQGLRGSRLAQLSDAVGYLSNKRACMKYDEYLAEGYPIGSGVAEGACRHLVKDRMEGTGMHWRVPGAQAMLHLRAVWLNDDWDAFQHHRTKEEQRLLYPYRPFVQQHWRKAA
jgi:hypothetical protein